MVQNSFETNADMGSVLQVTLQSKTLSSTSSSAQAQITPADRRPD